MVFGFLKSSPFLETEPTQWLFDAYAWSLRNFNAHVFFNDTILVVPSNAYFPGREDSIPGMANLIFNKAKEYAGLNHWPCVLVDPDAFEAMTTIAIKFDGPLRGTKANSSLVIANEQQFIIPYNPQQVTHPEALIASYAHVLAHYLGAMVKEPPPGGEDNWPHATELLAIFMGFGLMFANSAYTFRGGCGSCYNPQANRSAFLSEQESTYALAIFCVLKNIPNQAVLPHLKKYLRSVYKKAVKYVRERSSELDYLKRNRGQI